MPCPLFEPQRKATIAVSNIGARLPLIFEFEGVCHGGRADIASAHRFRYCNHGYAQGHCLNLPADPALSALRFNVTGRTPAMLSVLVVEEKNYWPLTWSKVEFVIADGRLVPEIDDVCRRAQVFQFCRSYLEKF